MHSWRVLILPYLGEQLLYSRYRLDEPWDGPNNIKLLDEVPACYVCESHNDNTLCHYSAVVGDGTGWRTDEPLKLTEFPGGLANTLVVSETLTGTPWTKPEDVTPNQLYNESIKHELNRLSGGHLDETQFRITGRCLTAGFADGHVSSVKLPQSVHSWHELASRLPQADEDSHNGDLSFAPIWKWDRILSHSLLALLCLLPSTRILSVAQVSSNNQ